MRAMCHKHKRTSSALFPLQIRFEKNLAPSNFSVKLHMLLTEYNFLEKIPVLTKNSIPSHAD